MRQRLRKYLPRHEAISENRWLAPFQSTLLHPRLWHLNRHSASGAVAVGLFCGLIPGPLQMLGSAIGATVFRVNLPIALLATFYTNPLTIIPLYLAAFSLGHWVLGVLGIADPHAFVPPPAFGEAGLLAWLTELIQWMLTLGKPLAIGLFLLATILALTGYFLTQMAWRLYLRRAQRRRAARQFRKDSPSP